MNEFSLIPFGLRSSDQQLVDVSEVERGRKCNCICPSCKTPLIARQGEINEWHFAHASIGVSNAIKSECEYSFWVSVALMAKQVIATAKSINVPSLNMYTKDAEKISITKQKVIFLDGVEVEKSLNAISADAVLKVGNFVIAVIFSAPNRHLGNYTPDTAGLKNVGVLEVSLLKAEKWLFGTKTRGRYSQILKHNILSSNDCKRWLYHPRKAEIEQQHDVTLQENNPAVVKLGHRHRGQVVVKPHHGAVRQMGPTHYICRNCNHSWFGTHECVHCGTHLYSSEIKNT